MKFDQDLRLNLRYDFGKMNSTLGSVVPLAMFMLAIIVAIVLDDFLISTIPSFDIKHIISSGVLSLNIIRPYQCLLVDLISF